MPFYYPIPYAILNPIHLSSIEQPYAPSTFYGAQWVYGDFRNSDVYGSPKQNRPDVITPPVERGQQLAELTGTEDILQISFRTSLVNMALFYTGLYSQISMTVCIMQAHSCVYANVITNV